MALLRLLGHRVNKRRYEVIVAYLKTLIKRKEKLPFILNYTFDELFKKNELLKDDQIQDRYGIYKLSTEKYSNNCENITRIQEDAQIHHINAEKFCSASPFLSYEIEYLRVIPRNDYHPQKSFCN
jgi:hypothetical protein